MTDPTATPPQMPKPGRVVFAHDHRFIPAEGQTWSEAQFEATLWDRYLEHFDGVTVVARKGGMPAGKTTADMELSSADGVSFELMPNLSSPKGALTQRGAARARMREIVGSHAAVIARLPSEIGLLAIEAAQQTGTPWAVEVVGCPYDGMRHYGSLIGRLYAPLAMRRMQRAVAQSDHAIYVTRAFLQKRYPSAARNTAGVSDVVLNAVLPQTLDKRLAHQAAHSGPIRLGLIGTLRGQFKGIQTLLDALKTQSDTLPDWQLHILGGGDQTPWKEAAKQAGLSDKVHFDGTLASGEAVFGWLDNIDIYLQPSLKEGLPRALVEAMSRGCPAIASTVAGIPELLPAADLMTPGDADGLARLLRERMGDADWMQTSARRNWTEAQGFQADILAEQRQAFWASFTAAARSAQPQQEAQP